MPSYGTSSQEEEEEVSMLIGTSTSPETKTTATHGMELPQRCFRLGVVTILCTLLVSMSYLVILSRSILFEIRGAGNKDWTPPINDHVSLLGSPKPVPEATSHSGTVLIVYLTDDDGQLQMASHVAKGVESVSGMSAILQSVPESSFEQVINASAVILGSSVENGNIHPQLQSWINEEWNIGESDKIAHTSKVGAAFVTAGGFSAGQESTLQSILRALLIFRFVLVGGETWTAAFGAAAVTHEAPFLEWTRDPVVDQTQGFSHVCYREPGETIHPMFLNKAYGLGRRVATVVKKLL